jgi:hypothetical protein
MFSYSDPFYDADALSSTSQVHRIVYPREIDYGFGRRKYEHCREWQAQ